MRTFKDLTIVRDSENDFAAKDHFDNGYGISVIRNLGSYGGGSGLYEIAVLDEDDNLCYDTPITDDVIGWLSEEAVTGVMEKIQALDA